MPKESTVHEVAFEWSHFRSKNLKSPYSIINNSTGKYYTIKFKGKYMVVLLKNFIS